MAKLPASCSDFWDAAIFDFTAFRNSSTASESAAPPCEEKLLGIEMALREPIGAVVLGVEVVDFTL